MRLQLENDRDKLDLDSVLMTGRGIQVTAGVTGFGLPPIQTRWTERAGDGAVFRSRRARPRDLDLPLTIVGRNRADLQALFSRLASMLAGPCRLRTIEDDGSSWWTTVHWVGGGQYAHGVDTHGPDENEVDIVITVRAPDPYWTAEKASQKILGGAA